MFRSTAAMLLIGTALSLAPVTGSATGLAPVVYGTPHAEAVLNDALASYVTAGRLRMELDNRAVELRAPAGAGTLAVQNVHFNPANGRFAADLIVEDTKPTVRQPVSGRAYGVVEVPVLSRRVAPGDAITAGDLAWTEVRVDQTSTAYAASDADLVGMTPKRGIPANQPVRLADVQSPRVIDKGAMVTITLESARIALSAQGKAMQDGGRGDVIRVVNVQSNRVVEATVVGPNLVAVAKPGLPIR